MATAADQLTPTIKLHPKQLLFHEAARRCDEVGFGGARGPGKSFMLCYEAIQWAVEYPGLLGAIVRQDLVDLKDTTLDVLKRYIMPRFVGTNIRLDLRGENSRPDLFVRCGDGPISQIMFRDTKDEASLMSANLAFLAMDEATEISEEFYLTVSAAVGRCTLADGRAVPGRIFWASNPGPGWLRREFPVGKRVARREAEIVDRDGRRRKLIRAFIPALAADNPHLPVDYEAKLRARYPDVWVRRFLDGDWDAFEGQVFDEFDESRHVFGFQLPAERLFWLHILALDWGFRNPAAAVLASVDGDGHWWIWREYGAAGRTPAEHLPYLRRMTAGLTMSAYLIDPAAVDQSDGVAMSAQFAALGMPMRGWPKRKHGPEGSIMFLKALLREGRISISPACVNLIREIKAARWQELGAAAAGKANPVERMVDKDDHWIDALFGAFEYWRDRGGRAADMGAAAETGEARAAEAEAEEYSREIVRRRGAGLEWAGGVAARRKGGWEGAWT